jgi:molybdopterin-guanine dinucleotide biosynthesis protein A
VAHVADALRPLAGSIAMIGDAEGACEVGATALFDPPGFPSGPLAGICAALEWATQESASLVMVAPCDTPLVTSEVFAQLVAALSTDTMVSCAVTSDGPHPLISVWRSELSSWLRAQLASGHPPVRDVLARAGLARVTISNADVCLNVNTPEDLERAELILQARR